MVDKASVEPLPELAAFLLPFAPHFVRSEGREDVERYCTGLLSDLPRKNGDTIAEAIPGTSSQRLQELLTRIQWDEAAFNTQRVEQMRDERVLGDGALLFDGTDFVRQGRHSVGVARQYSGSLGKVANCQVAVTGVYADAAGSWPLDAQLYLPHEWSDDPQRCAQAGVPSEVGFRTKPQMALEMLDYARRLHIPHKVVVADSEFGKDGPFLSGLEGRGECYVIAVPCDFHVQLLGHAQEGSQRADELLRQQAPSAWKTIAWREGTKGWLRKKFIALRAYRTVEGVPQQLGWLIGERPARGQQGDWKYYFSNFPKAMPLTQMVEYAHRRWHIEQFHEGAKSLLGWDQYQGRLWTGFHRHATLVLLAYSFLQGMQGHHRRTAPKPPGRPRDPFSPSTRSAATVPGAHPSTGHRRPL